jgi:glucokinase
MLYTFTRSFVLCLYLRRKATPKTLAASEPNIVIGSGTGLGDFTWLKLATVRSSTPNPSPESSFP